MSRRAIQGFGALRNDNGGGVIKGLKGDEKAMLMMNNNLPNYTVRTPTSRGTQTLQTEPMSWTSSPHQKTSPLQALRSRNKSPKDSTVDATSAGVKACICYREHTSVACCSCGFLLAGRVRIQCPCHPNTIHLMDVERCPECCSSTLTEVRTT